MNNNAFKRTMHTKSQACQWTRFWVNGAGYGDLGEKSRQKKGEKESVQANS